MLQCQRAELSSQPGMSREALPWSLRPFLFPDLPSLSHCPLERPLATAGMKFLGFQHSFIGVFGNDSPLPITKKGLWPLGRSSCNVSRALKQCLANIWQLQRLHLFSKVEISWILKSYMSFCGEFCLLRKIFLNPAKLNEEAVWLGCSVTLERMKYLVIFSGVQLNSSVVAVAKPMWKWLKRLPGIKCYPSGNPIHWKGVVK